MVKVSPALADEPEGGRGAPAVEKPGAKPSVVGNSRWIRVGPGTAVTASRAELVGILPFLV